MAFTKVHHVGLVVPDLEQAKHILCEGFGLSVNEHRSPWPEGRPGYDGTTILEFPIGEMHYEIAKPNQPGSDAAKFLESTKGRGGIYYISIASDDISADVQGLRDRGIKLKADWNGEGTVFLDPTTCLGLGIQITPDDHYYPHPYYLGNGVVTGMAHIGVAARSVGESRRFWTEAMGMYQDPSNEQNLEEPVIRTPQPADDPVYILEYPIGGSVIEISHPTTTDSGTARLVAQRASLGAVYHHTCPFAPDVHTFTEQALSEGLQQIGIIPPREESAEAIAWFHPRTCLGMLLEVWNRPPGDGHYHQRTVC